METFKADDSITISYEERREISQKTIVDLENDELLPMIDAYTDKYKLAAFTMLRSARSFYSHSMRAKVDKYCVPFHGMEYSREKMVKFQEHTITKSLCRFKRENTEDALGGSYRKQIEKLSIDIFRNILIFTDVIQTGNNRDKIDAAGFVLRCGLSHCLLRDEVYAQILKQLDLTEGDGDGKDGVALILGFKLLYLCLCSFGSSQEMAMILLSRICLHCQPVPRFCAFRNVGEIAVNCFKAWRLMVEGGDSGSVPQEMQRVVTDEQIGHILYSKALPIRLEVHLPDDTKIRLNVHSFCTMAELIEMVCRRFGLSEWIKDFTLRIRANVEGFVVRTNSNLFSADSQVVHWYGRWKDIVKKHPIMRWKIYVKCHLKDFLVCLVGK